MSRSPTSAGRPCSSRSTAGGCSPTRRSTRPARHYAFGWGTSSRQARRAGGRRRRPAADRRGAADPRPPRRQPRRPPAGALLPSAGTVLTTVPGAPAPRAAARAASRRGATTRLTAPGRPDLEVTATPARHGPPLSGRSSATSSASHCAGTAQRHGALWITGDTVLYDGVREVADRAARSTSLVVHLGGVRFPITGPLRYTMTGRQGGRAVSTLVRPRVAVPGALRGLVALPGRPRPRSSASSPRRRPTYAQHPLAAHRRTGRPRINRLNRAKAVKLGGHDPSAQVPRRSRRPHRHRRRRMRVRRRAAAGRRGGRAGPDRGGPAVPGGAGVPLLAGMPAYLTDQRVRRRRRRHAVRAGSRPTGSWSTCPTPTSDDVYVIDPATYKVIDKFYGGPEPQHVVPSYDMRTLYVTSSRVPAGGLRADRPAHRQAGRDHRRSRTSTTSTSPRTAVRDRGRRGVPAAGLLRPEDLEAGQVAEVPAVRGHQPHGLHRRRQDDAVQLRVRQPDDRRRRGQRSEGARSFDLDVVPDGMPQDTRLTPDGQHFLVADMHADGVYVFDGAGHRAHRVHPDRRRRARHLLQPGRRRTRTSPTGARAASPCSTWPR